MTIAACPHFLPIALLAPQNSDMRSVSLQLPCHHHLYYLGATLRPRVVILPKGHKLSCWVSTLESQYQLLGCPHCWPQGLCRRIGGVSPVTRPTQHTGALLGDWDCP